MLTIHRFSRISRAFFSLNLGDDGAIADFHRHAVNRCLGGGWTRFVEF
jgi:hypothetical protein